MHNSSDDETHDNHNASNDETIDPSATCASSF